MAKNNSCGVCGRKGKRRCPAVDGMICPTCCGAHRGSKLDCPSGCTSYPFGTEAYDLWLRIDGSWFPKALKYVASHVEPSEFSHTIHRLTTTAHPERNPSKEAGLVNAVHYYLGVATTDFGMTLGELWEEEGWPGLNNDERIMTAHRRHTWPGILEVQKVVNAQATECVDLLDPGRGSFMIYDRATAGKALRFSRYLVWITHYPYFSRVAGIGMEVSSHIHEQFMEELLNVANGRKRRVNLADVKRYVAENFADYCDLLTEIGIEYRERAIRSMDVIHCRAWYDFNATRDRIQAVITSKPDFDRDKTRDLEPEDPPGTEYYHWFRRGEAKEFEKGRAGVFRHETEEDGVGVLGSLKLYGDSLMMETFGQQKFDFARKLVSSYFGDLLKLRDQELVDIAEQVLSGDHQAETETASEPVHRESEIPIEVEQQVIQQAHRRHYEKFLEDSIPALNGFTPRQAATSREMRPRLIELMKDHLHGIEQQSRENGFDLDIEWVLDELDLDELRS